MVVSGETGAWSESEDTISSLVLNALSLERTPSASVSLSSSACALSSVDDGIGSRGERRRGLVGPMMDTLVVEDVFFIPFISTTIDNLTLTHITLSCVSKTGQELVHTPRTPRSKVSRFSVDIQVFELNEVLGPVPVNDGLDKVRGANRAILVQRLGERQFTLIRGRSRHSEKVGLTEVS